MTTIDLYRKHKAGEVSREKFLYEVRRDNNLPFITNLTSYDDAVKILKNKGIITEATLKDLVQPLVAKLESMGFETEIDPYGGYKTLFAWKTFPNGNTLTVFVGPSDYELNVRDYKGFDEFSTIDVSFKYYTTEITKKLFGLYKSKKRVMQALPDEGGREIDLGVGMFDIPIEDSVERIASLVRKAEQKVPQTNSDSLNESATKEAKKDEAVKAEVKPKKPSEKKPSILHIDQANPYEYRHGLQHELCELDDYSDEALEKAKDKVLKNLAKDANYYSNLLNQKQSPFEFKKSETDAKGMQAKADGHLKKELKKNEKSNVQDTLGKKEAGKKKPKGVKIMPDKGVTGSEKTIKEGLEANIQKLIDAGYSENDAEDFADEFEQGGSKVPQKVKDILTGKEKVTKEGLEVKQDDDQIEISADSGDYVGEIENGKVSFSVYFDDMESIENEFGPEGITDENWKDILGPNHAFVKIIDTIGGDVEAIDDYVQITVDANKLTSLKEANPNYKPAIGSTADKYMKPRPGGPLFSPEEREEAEFDSLKMKIKGWYRTNFANPKSQLASKWDNEFYDKVEAASNKEELKQIVKSILMGDTSSAMRTLGLDETKKDKHSNLKEMLKKFVKEVLKETPIDDNIKKAEDNLANLYTQKADALKQSK
jgi:hypothetical protein